MTWKPSRASLETKTRTYQRRSLAKLSLWSCGITSNRYYHFLSLLSFFLLFFLSVYSSNFLSVYSFFIRDFGGFSIGRDLPGLQKTQCGRSTCLTTKRSSSTTRLLTSMNFLFFFSSSILFIIPLVILSQI